MSTRRLALSAWALLVAQVVHGLTPADTDAEGHVGLVGGLLLLVATMTAIAGLRGHGPWAARLTAWTGLAVAAGFVLYHATPVTSPVTNPYIGQPAGPAAWITVTLSIAAGLWAAHEARLQPRTPLTASPAGLKCRVSPANEVSGPRSNKGRRTRASLIEAGKVVFARDGFLKARIVDIAAEAGAAYGVFYHCFDSKETLFREIAEEVEVRLLSMDDVPHDRAAPVDPYERIREASRSYLTAYCENAGIMRVIEEVSHYDEHVRAVRQRRQDEFGARQAASIRRLQKDGLADPDIDPKYAAMALSSMVVAFAAALCVSSAPYEFDQAIEQLTKLWVNALGLDNGNRPR